MERHRWLLFAFVLQLFAKQKEGKTSKTKSFAMHFFKHCFQTKHAQIGFGPAVLEDIDGFASLQGPFECFNRHCNEELSDNSGLMMTIRGP